MRRSRPLPSVTREGPGSAIALAVPPTATSKQNARPQNDRADARRHPSPRNNRDGELGKTGRCSSCRYRLALLIRQLSCWNEVPTVSQLQQNNRRRG
jgi:hypothetical protein